MSKIVLQQESSTPSTPAAGKWAIYLKSTGLFIVDSASNVIGPFISNAGLVIGVNIQAWSAALDIWSGKTAPSGTVVGTTDTQVMTNKRVTPRMHQTTSTATLTPEIATYDYYELTAQAAALNIANMATSTPTGGEKITVAITSDATPRALTYGTDYVAKGGVALPTTTVASKTTTLGFIRNAGLVKWVLVAVAQEA